jgi:hypothetical protein
MTAQTVWLPTSSRLVSQQPSRKNPVMGFIEQTSSRSPSTLRGGLRRPPPLPLSSLSIADSACAEIWVSKRRPAILRGRAKCSAFLVGRKIFIHPRAGVCKTDVACRPGSSHPSPLAKASFPPPLSRGQAPAGTHGHGASPRESGDGAVSGNPSALAPMGPGMGTRWSLPPRESGGCDEQHESQNAKCDSPAPNAEREPPGSVAPSCINVIET